MTEEIIAKFDEKEILELWDNRSGDWDIEVGEDGDSNRILNSDPVLWNFTGNVAGLSVLDAGCGTGYLALSPQMIEIAKFRASQNNLDIDFHLDSCTELKSLPDEQFDIINYPSQTLEATNLQLVLPILGAVR